MGDVEKGICDICGKKNTLTRKYYHYDVLCECCNGLNDPHFEIVRHCSGCEPSPPNKITANIKPMDGVWTLSKISAAILATDNATSIYLKKLWDDNNHKGLLQLTGLDLSHLLKQKQNFLYNEA